MNERPYPCEQLPYAADAQHHLCRANLCGILGGTVLLQQVGVYHLFVGKHPLWCMDDLVLEAEEGA